VEPITVVELYNQLLSHEQRWELWQTTEYHATNAAARGGRGSFGHGRGDPGRGNGGRENNYNSSSRGNLQCQLFGKKGHVVQKCFKHFDRNFSGEEKTAAPATTSYGIYTNWYADSGATDHITGDLDKLAIRDKYGGDQVHKTNGSGMKIWHIRSTTLHTPSHDLVFKNVLHVPDANKNLVSIHHLALDNHVFLELHLWFFLSRIGNEEGASSQHGWEGVVPP
jgi:hypothetical protein